MCGPRRHTSACRQAASRSLPAGSDPAIAWERSCVYAVMNAFDPSWESAVSFTILIAADGTGIDQYAGEADRLKLRRAFLAQLPDAGTFAGKAAYW